MRGSIAALALLLAFSGGCSPQKPEAGGKPMSQDAGWDVLKNGKKVLWIKNAPGTITSRAMLPPGAQPMTHPFLTAESYDPMEENTLLGLREKARSFDEFVALLKKGGYVVTPVKPGQ